MMAMPKLPATFAEAEASLLKTEALAYAREFVRMICDEQIVSYFGLPLFWFEKPDSQRLVRQFMKEMAQTPQGMMDLCNLARTGWSLADEAARELIQDHSHRREDMPPTLAAYNMEIVDPRRAYRRLPSPKKSDNFLRDMAIVAGVGDVCARFGLKPTRQRASRRDRLSGCSIFAEALTLERVAVIGESAVVEIWRRYGGKAFPDGFHVLTGLRPL
jgi:hypothetical protein